MNDEKLSYIDKLLEKEENKQDINQMKKLQEKRSQTEKAYEQTLKEIEKCNGLMDSLDFKLISREDVPRMPPLVEKYHKYEKRLNRVQELKNSKKIK